MEIQAKLERKNLQKELIVVYINPRDRDMIVKTLQTFLKAKNDRLDGYVLDSLIDALANPEIAPIEQVNYDDPVEPILKQDIQSKTKISDITDSETMIADKIRVVNEIKSKIEAVEGKPKNVNDFIKESIDYAKAHMDVKTKPKSNSVESFYDWMVENKIIDKNGNPMQKR
jgi:hypothetical protein